ncbi:hypothetical protein Tco_0597452 [Tanacetum coccineum]
MQVILMVAAAGSRQVKIHSYMLKYMFQDCRYSDTVLITKYLVNISKRHAFWSLNEDILKIYYSDYQYAVSIKEDTAYLCLHSSKTTKERRSIRRCWGLVKVTSAVINVELSLVPPELGPLSPSLKTELITSDLICPLTYQLLRNSGGDSGPDLSFDKSATLERLFSSARIERTVTLFRVFQTLCKQGDWFSFTKRHTHSPVCIDDNRSCMKHWKIGFFFIDQWPILDAMVWRHLNAVIDDLRPAAGSFNMADVRRLSAHVIKLRDMIEGVLVLSGLSRIWKSHVCDLVLQGVDGNGIGVGFNCFVLCPWPLLLEFIVVFLFYSYGLPFYCTPPTAVEAVIPNPTSEELAVGTPSFKIVAKAEASQKRKASTSSAASSHVAKRTRSALAQSSGSTTHPSLFVGDDNESDDDDDDDACVEIPLVTPLHSAAVIPFSGNQGGSSVAPTTEGSNTRDSQGKGVMDDDDAPPSSGMSRPRPSSGPAPSFKDVSDDSIHMNFFPFATGPYYATYPEGGVVGNCEFTREDVLHCMMMSHGGELLARYRRLDQSHHEYVLSADSRLKGYEEKVANMTGLELQVADLKKQVSGLNDKLTSSDASFAKSKAKGKERKKKIKSLGKSLDNLHAEVARLSVVLNQATILEAERDEEILRLKDTPPEFSSFFRGQFQGLVRKFLASDEFSRVQGELLSLAASVGFEHGLSMHRTKDEFDAVLNKMVNFMPGVQDRLLEPEKLVRPANVPIPRGTRVSPPIAKESTVTPVSESLELSANVNFTASAVASEHNEEMVNAEVDGSDPKMTDDTAAVKSGHAFMQGIFVALNDVTELVEVGSGCVSSGPDDFVVALSSHEKGDGLDSSFAAGEEAVVNPLRGGARGMPKNTCCSELGAN